MHSRIILSDQLQVCSIAAHGSCCDAFFKFAKGDKNLGCVVTVARSTQVLVM